MKITVIAKGNNRKRRALQRALALMRESSLFDEVAVFATEYPGHAVELARRECGGTDYLVAAGGDGTLNEVVNGCLQAAGEAATALPTIAVLALGTSNDFLKSTALSGTAAELLQLVRSGVSRSIDIGRICYAADDGGLAQRYFVNVADAGIGAAVVKAVQRRRACLGPGLCYLLAILASLVTFRKPVLSVVSDQAPLWQGKAIAVVAGNGSCFGSGIRAVPQARMDDGLLHITVLGNVGIMDFIRHIGALKRGRTIRHPEVAYHAVRRLHLTSPGTPCAIEADGEFLGYTPASIDILPGALRFLFPA